MNLSGNKPISFAKPSSLVVVDIMRGVSALGVAWFHSRSDLWIGFKFINADRAAYSVFDRVLSYFSLPISQMGGMVMLFFVLSGFCIHLPTARRKVAPAWNIYLPEDFCVFTHHTLL
jgi:peptidoglycan/LPS O-acetylase OafA/YrhL